MPPITSRTRFCAPKPTATLARPARVSAGVGLMPTLSIAVKIATNHTTLLAVLYTTSASVRVCCSRACSLRDWLSARLISRLVITRKKRLTSNAMTKIPSRCRRTDKELSFKNESRLDIGNSTGEYNIESASMLAEGCLFARGRSPLGAIYVGIKTDFTAQLCRGGSGLLGGGLCGRETGTISEASTAVVTRPSRR